MADTLIGTCHKDVQLLMRSSMKVLLYTYQSLIQIMVYRLQRDTIMKAKKGGMRKNNRWILAQNCKQTTHSCTSQWLNFHKLRVQAMAGYHLGFIDSDSAFYTFETFVTNTRPDNSKQSESLRDLLIFKTERNQNMKKASFIFIRFSCRKQWLVIYYFLY